MKRARIGILMVVMVGIAGVSMAQKGTKPPATNDTRRAFYMTQDAFDGSQAPTACTAGFHMASIWEILDPSALKYDTTLGLTRADSGGGPPSGFAGWVRTGWAASAVETLGAANCNGYTSNDATLFGTRVGLGANWGTDVSRVSPWVPLTTTCNGSPATKVWCVQD